MKRFTVLILVLLSLLILWWLSFSCHKNKDNQNIDIIYVDRSSTANRLCEFDNTYYYTSKQGIYSNNKCTLNTNGKPLIYTNDDTLFVYANNRIIGYDKSLSPICEYDLLTEAVNFAVSDNEIFLIDTGGEYHVLDKSTLAEKKEVETEKIKGNNIICRYTDFLICKDLNNFSISVFFNSNQVFSSVKDYSEQFVYISDNYLVHTSSTNTSTINLCKTMLSDKTNDNTIDLPTGYGMVSLFHLNDDIIFIGSEYPLDPHIDFKKSYNLYYHQRDCIVTVNINDYKITNTRFTKNHEKIIYADNKKVITYYNGKYLTYLIENWKVINKQSANEIKNGGSYTFETCGDFIFVFDDNSGELLNTIDIT